MSLWVEARSYSLSQLAFITLMFLVFGGCVWTGIDLWMGKSRGHKWAKVFFILQIPNISFPGFAYHFYTGVMFCLSFSQEVDSKLDIEFQLGSSMKMLISPKIEDLIFGVNLVAIAALIYLTKVSPKTVSLNPAVGGGQLSTK